MTVEGFLGLIETVILWKRKTIAVNCTVLNTMHYTLLLLMICMDDRSTRSAIQ